MRAYKDNVLVRMIAEENKTKSGIKLPEKYNPVKGTVVSVGDSVNNLNVGDIIYYNRLTSTWIKDDVFSISCSAIHCVEENV